MVKKRFYSNGKILLTGEYAILFGARSLAFPLIYGQEMIVHPEIEPEIIWKAFAEYDLWFEARYALPNLDIKSTNDTEKAIFLKEILVKLFAIEPQLLQTGLIIQTKTNFPVNWGFGTSSTLIHNLAIWANINPYKLFYSVSKGSGYDIACAGSNSPILFERQNSNPSVEAVDFHKPFLENIYLVYSGRKRATEKHLTGFLAGNISSENTVRKISAITDKVVHSKSLEEFIDLMILHEEIIGELIQKQPVQQELYENFDGGIKSLGAWGGDFFLAASNNGSDYVRHYFERFGLAVILPFQKSILM
jgi:mevalonate kinase